MRTLIFILLSFKLSASEHIVICGKYNSPQPVNIKMYEPIKGYFNNYLIDYNIGELIVKDDSFYYKIPATLPACYKLYFTYSENDAFAGAANILMIPGDSVHMNIDLLKHDDQWISYHGSNAEGNQLFEKINYKPITKFLPFHQLLKELPDDKNNFVNRVEEQIAQIIREFTVLLEKGKISPQYYAAMEATLEVNIYTNIIRRLLSEPHFNALIEKKWKDSVAGLWLEKKFAIPVINGLFNASLFVELYEKFKVYQENNYTNIYDYDKINVKHIIKDSLIEVNHVLGYLPYIDDKIKQEELWAFALNNAFRFLQGYFKKDILDQFNFIFPNSFFLPILQKTYEKNKLEEISYSTTRKIVYVDTIGQVKDLKNFVESFYKDKHVYIDIWATWCGPCISEFRHNSKIDSFLLRHQVERLYISIDNLQNLPAWKKNIERYQLGGEHIISGLQLRNEIRNWLSLKEDEPLSIPRYFFITAKGRVYLAAPFPGDSDFEKQMENYLKDE